MMPEPSPRIGTTDLNTAATEFQNIRNQIQAIVGAGHPSLLTAFQVSPAQMGLALMCYTDQKAAGGGGPSGLAPTQVLFGKSDGTIAQDAGMSYAASPTVLTVGNTYIGKVNTRDGIKLSSSTNSFINVDTSGSMFVYLNGTQMMLLDITSPAIYFQQYIQLASKGTATPPNPSEGMMWYDNGAKAFKCYANGTVKTFTIT